MSFEMPNMDDHLTECGMVTSTGGCTEVGVVRMVVEMQYSDEDRYYTGPFFIPYMGDEVMMLLCAEHRDEVEAEHENALRIVRGRQEARTGADKEVKVLEEQLRVARAKRNRI